MNRLNIDVLLLAALFVFLFALYVITIMARRERRSDDEALLGEDEQTLGSRLRTYYPDLIRQAGIRSKAGAGVFWVCKAFLAILIPLLAMEFFYTSLYEPLGFWLPFLGALLGFVIPDLYVSQLRRERQTKIRRRLSYFVDLTVSLLHSGLTLDQAFLRAARDGFPDRHPLAEEVGLLGREMDLGRDRSEALFELVRRTGVREIKAIAAAVRMGLRIGGTGVARSLESQAELLRDQRQDHAIRRISRAAAVAAIPVFLCGVPVYLVIIYFPAVIRLLDALRGVRSM